MLSDILPSSHSLVSETLSLKTTSLITLRFHLDGNRSVLNLIPKSPSLINHRIETKAETIWSLNPKINSNSQRTIFRRLQMYFTTVIIAARQRSFGKEMFSQVIACPPVGGGGRADPISPALEADPQKEHGTRQEVTSYPPGTNKSGRCASYWNAFFLINVNINYSCTESIILCIISTSCIISLLLTWYDHVIQPLTWWLIPRGSFYWRPLCDLHFFLLLSFYCWKQHK